MNATQKLIGIGIAGGVLLGTIWIVSKSNS
jgi:hypothetical protein